MATYQSDEKIKKKFNELEQQIRPQPKTLKNCIMAFIIGGLICVIAQFIRNYLLSNGFPEEQVSIITPMTMVFLAALLTGLDIYDKIAAVAGAGTIVPITGFSNAMVSPAIEFKKEGFVMGVGAKMFTIAGPVIVYGVGTSVIVGVIYYLLLRFGFMG
ncbi:stage V sporulation protein AC [Clostridium sp. LIBA-8841]|uniref:stage V sporulation protein AC n=1 Tax=Clostridium sp. LIBA-8841 TaxID=2987530 RepID=UPI002AC645FD|nr:stage V sporulation protein AC [Clostridium sp. LIBA-8841]MDZ5252997.1 stage V sporulation protein AC [Clostridium sp. LIBA-8841]